MTRTRRSLPFEAFDARLFDYWRRGTVEAFVLASATSDPEADLPSYVSECSRLVRLNQLMNSARAAAKRDKAPGWEDLYRAVVRLTKDSDGRICRLTVEPRTAELDTLLGAESPTPTGLRPAPQPSTGEVPTDIDILEEIFGPATGGTTPEV